MDEHCIVMTLPSSRWKDYGSYSLPTIDKFWPKDIPIYLYVEGDQNIPFKSERLHVIDMTDLIEQKIKPFEERNKDRPIFDMEVDVDITHQAAKFARKVYAQLDVLTQKKAKYVWYLDADFVTLAPVTKELLKTITGKTAYLGCLPRWQRKKFTETGFMFWDTEHTAHEEWCKHYDECYSKDIIFQYPEWHDCYAFDHATLTLLNQKKIEIVDMGFGDTSRHPLVKGPLGKYFDHLKGGRKTVGYSKERIQAHGK